jgi:hypothetical protein
MVLLGTADNSLQVAHELALRTVETLSNTARRIYTALVGAGLEVALEREYSPKVTQVVFFACAESVALAVGVHPSTVYRKLPELHQAGLVHCRGHFCTHNQRTRSDGSVWAVRLTPTGSAARVPFDWLKKQYRCLGADIEAGRTAWQQMRESYPSRDKSGIRLDYILRWALSTPSKNLVTFDPRTAGRVDISAIFDVPAVSKQDRAETIYNAAKAISSAIQDSNTSQRFFMAVLWNLCRVRDRTGADYFGALHTMICRVRADVEEDFARSGFALLYSRLKQAGLLGDLLRSS